MNFYLVQKSALFFNDLLLINYFMLFPANLKHFFKKNLILSCHVLQLCPTFSSSIIKNILDVFVPDEFCPDPIQGSLLEALELEVSLFNS